MPETAARRTADPRAPAAVEYARRLTLFDGVMVVIGGIVGAGIFLNPAVVARRAGTAGLTLAAWSVGGAIALLGALCFAELGARRPRTGGGYVYLSEAFGPLPAFLYGWTQLLVINTGGIAAVAVTFARYAVELAGAPQSRVKPVAVAAIVLLTAVNCMGVRPGSRVQNAFTLLKLAALAALIGVGLGGLAATPAAVAPTAPGAAPLAALSAALLPVLFSYGGWQHANHVAGEMIRPRRDLPRALIAGVAVVVAVYLLANVAYLRVLGPGGLAVSAAPASDTMRAVVGRVGAQAIAAGIAASTFGILNLFILAVPRVYQAMAADGLFFRGLAELHPRFRTPVRALLLQGAWALVLTLSGSYGQLLDYVVFGDWIFFALVAATLFVYRQRGDGAGEEAAGFRLRGYPWIPALFVGISLLVVVSSVASNPVNAAVGTLLIAAGAPIHSCWRRTG
jgi:APA family basic amino acid/polyamine antiporter